MDTKIRKRLVKDSIGVLFWKIAGAIGLLAFYSVAAHAMSTAEFGKLSYYVALAMVASVLANGGLQRDAVRIGEAAYRNGNGTIFLKDMRNSSAYILLMFALVGIVIWSLAAVGVLNLTGWLAFAIILAFIGARAYVIFFGEIIRGLHDGRTGTAIQQSIPYLVASAIVFILFQFSNEQTAATALLSLTVGTGVALLVGVGSLYKARKRMHGSADSEVNFKFGLLAPFVLTDFLLAMQQQGHVMILAGVANPEEIAHFSAAFRAATLVALPLSVVNSSIPSTIAELYIKNEIQKLNDILGYTSSIVFILAVVLCVPLLLFSEVILGYMFGHEYKDADMAFTIMIVAQLVNVWTGSPGRVIVIAKAGRAFFSITLIAVVAGLMITYIFGNAYGSIGAAIGVLISLSTHNLLMTAYCKVNLGVKSYSDLRSMRLVVWKVRYAIEGRACKSRLFMYIEKILRAGESIRWRMQKKIIIECIGDSHSRVFRHINLTQSIFKYRSVVIQGATARGLSSLRSITNSRAMALDAIKSYRARSEVVLLFGEVDCANTLWVLANSRKLTLDSLLEETIAKYISFAQDIAMLGHTVYMVSVPLPYLEDSDQETHLIKERRRLMIPRSDIMELTRNFNCKLRNACETRNIYYVDLCTEVLDSTTKTVKTELKSDKIGDHHYNRPVYARLLHDAIRKQRAGVF